MMTAAWIVLLIPLVALVGIWGFCILRLLTEHRRCLFPAGVTAIVLALVLFGGELLLGCAGMTWLQAMRLALSVLLWGTGLLAGGLTVYYANRAAEGKNTARLLCAAAGLCLIVVILYGTFLGGLWLVRCPEQVGTWKGHSVVQVKKDSWYVLYEYHSPFARGVESLGWSEGDMLDP